MAREDFKPQKGGKGNMLLRPGTLQKLLAAAERPEVVMDPAQFDREEKAGKIHYRYRTPESPSQRPGGGGGGLQFAIGVTATELTATAGVVAGSAFAAHSRPSPANGDWYLQAGVVINNTTGEITSRSLVWTQSQSSNSATNFYTTLGEVNVDGGVPLADSIVQYNYGPLLTLRHGGVAQKWALTMF